MGRVIPDLVITLLGTKGADKALKAITKTKKATKAVDRIDDVSDAGKAVSKVDDILAAGKKIDFLNKDFKNISNMTKKEILNNVPNGWKIYDNNGFVHIKDANGIIRVRIDPPDNMTPYKHIHILDENGNTLDINGKIVDKKSPNAHKIYK